MVTTKQQVLLDKINELLEQGDKTVIAKKLGTKSSRAEVYAVLRGNYYKDLVIEAALDFLANKKQKGDGISPKIRQKALAVLG